MAINLNDPEVETLLQQRSKETGEPHILAAGTAVRERLERVRLAKKVPQQRLLRAMLELIEEARAAPVLDPRPLKVIRDGVWGEE